MSGTPKNGFPRAPKFDVIFDPPGGVLNIELAPEQECRVWQTLAEDELTCVTNAENLMPEGMLEQMQKHRFMVSPKANPDLRLAYDENIGFNKQFSLMEVSEIPEGQDQFLLDTGSDEDHFAISLAKNTWWGIYLKQTKNTRLRSYIDQFNIQKNQISPDRSFGFKKIGDYFLLHASTNSDYVAEMTPENFYISGYAEISDASLFKINLICDYPMILRSDGFACIYDPELRVEQAVFDSLMNQPVRIESLVNNYRLGLRDELKFNNYAALSISPHVLNAMGQKLKMVPLETSHNFYCDRCFHLTFYDFTTRNFDIAEGYKSDSKVHLYNAHTGGNQVFRLIKQGENYKILAAANLDFAMTVDLANFDCLSINDNNRETMEADQTFKITVLNPEARECPAWMVSINDGTACADNPEYDLPATLLSEMQRNNFYLSPKVNGDNQVIQINKTGGFAPVQVVETDSENANRAHQIFKADAGTQEGLIRMSIAASSFWGLRLATSDRINNFDAFEVHKSVNQQKNDILIKKVGDAFILVSAENPDYVVNFTAEKAYLTAYPVINDASLGTMSKATFGQFLMWKATLL